MTNWTMPQSNAIKARNGTVLVSAAAGSGKTAVLVQRVIELLLDQEKSVDVDTLLIVTFTNAAAAEMRERISKAIEQQLALNPNNTHLKRQQILLANAKICTIDSFCMDLVKEYFYLLSIEQDYIIIDKADEVNLQNIALNSVLEKMYSDGDEDFLELVELLSGLKNDELLCDAIIKLYTYSMVSGDPKYWLEHLADVYENDDFLSSKWFKILIEFVYENVVSAISYVEQALKTFCGCQDVYEKVESVLKADIKSLSDIKYSIETNQNYDNIFNLIQNISFGRMPRISSDYEFEKEKCSDLRKKAKGIIDKLKQLFCADFEQAKLDNQKTYLIVSTLSECVQMFSDELMALKKEKNSFSFADIEQFALRLLVEQGNPTPLAIELKNKYTEILIDEYQDTNTAQDTLFSTISNDKNMFMVGDVKQSIYRFRQAMPQIFNSKKNVFCQYDGENFPSKIILDKNFRSRNGVCEFINFLFSKLMSEQVGEMLYQDEDMLSAGFPYPDLEMPSVQMHIVENEELKSDTFDEIEANYIAELIIKKVKNKELICDKNMNIRPCDYGDFAILFRSASSHIPNYESVFKNLGIPVAAQSSSSFVDNPEIKTIVSLLKVLDNPMQDIPLLSVMLSPIFAFSEDEIANMRINDRKSSLYVCIKNYSKINEKTKLFLDRLSYLRTYCGTMSVSSLVRKIIDETSYAAIVKSMGSPEQRMSNLYLFMELADNYQTQDNKGLAAFIRMIDKGGLDVDSAKILDNAQNAVRMMSIHHSKGLEFPICILAGTTRKFSNKSAFGNCILHPELGVGIKLLDKSGEFSYQTLPYNAVKIATDRAEMSENLRVLYVALTRARVQLITVTTVNSLENKMKSLDGKMVNYKGISPLFVGDANSDADWLLMCMTFHKDGKILRKIIGFEEMIDDNNFDVDIILSSSELKKSDQENEAELVSVNDEIISQIDGILNYKYPFSELSSLAAKRNASALDENEYNYDFFASSRPAFLDDEGLTSAQKGTAMHSFMQHCDYQKAKNNLNNEAQRMCDLGFLSNSEFESLDYGSLNTFFNSELANRMFVSKKLMREIKFSTFVDAKEIYDINIDNEKIFVQGIADCVFIENNELVIVDYKTDRVKSEEQLLNRYRKQIEFYAKALEKTLGLPVKTTMLYSFYMNKSISY